MVTTESALEDIDLLLVTNLSDDLTTPQANIFHEDFLTIFGNPNQVIQTTISGVRGVSILACHVPILLC